MDIDMPIKNGYETTIEIIGIFKNIYRAIPPPIVACTAFVGEEERVKAEGVGMCGFINKPVKKSDILYCVQKYLNYK